MQPSLLAARVRLAGRGGHTVFTWGRRRSRRRLPATRKQLFASAVTRPRAPRAFPCRSCSGRKLQSLRAPCGSGFSSRSPAVFPLRSSLWIRCGASHVREIQFELLSGFAVAPSARSLCEFRLWHWRTHTATGQPSSARADRSRYGAPVCSAARGGFGRFWFAHSGSSTSRFRDRARSKRRNVPRSCGFCVPLTAIRPLLRRFAGFSVHPRANARASLTLCTADLEGPRRPGGWRPGTSSSLSTRHFVQYEHKSPVSTTPEICGRRASVSAQAPLARRNNARDL